MGGRCLHVEEELWESRTAAAHPLGSRTKLGGLRPYQQHRATLFQDHDQPDGETLQQRLGCPDSI